MVWTIRAIQNYRFPQWVPSWGEGWLWKPLENSNSGTYSTTTPSETYEPSQWGLGDLIVGKETNKSVQTIATAAMVLGGAYLVSKVLK